MTDYSAFPYNCEDCGHMLVCKYHERYDQNEQIIEALYKLMDILEERI